MCSLEKSTTKDKTKGAGPWSVRGVGAAGTGCWLGVLELCVPCFCVLWAMRVMGKKVIKYLGK